MIFIRLLFVLGLVLVFVHRLILAATPVWFDIFVAAYLIFVVVIVALVVFFKKKEAERRNKGR
jgi:hypothetical protein